MRLARAAEKVRTLEYDNLRSDPYDPLALVAHEAFHVYQHHAAPDRGANEMLLLNYPVLSVENNVHVGLEGSALRDALRARDDGPYRGAAIRWLAIRLEHPVARAELERQPGTPVGPTFQSKTLQLPGGMLQLQRGAVHWEAGLVRVVLQAASADSSLGAPHDRR